MTAGNIMLKAFEIPAKQQSKPKFLPWEGSKLQFLTV